ncbi:ribosome recycling factor [Xiashengella succiniciproducens]|jgi:ribosome recycling factor|uniref:Ribosome-recycling factor n=1 Tax=Xiashengella succiniciproducens TaxID=2949635 RepID=A0A9J6ZPZ4_9BACT|nr:ribosome recycling factor [Alkaliflexus sp. Ai-910]MDI9538016.1 ribosome recycling factor [Bacteroidota bacterium]URW79713.1 ribosome recycling factor [Alkaliflexus sp. Ai-910]HHT99954.1 ribosome recycling factor [Bacteroidales bacterium]
MEEEVSIVFEDATEKMNKAIDHLDKEMSKVRAGKASPKILEGIMVDYYGTMTPLAQVANVNTPDPRTIAIQPWEKKLIPVIEKAIMAANLGLNPDNNGELIRINVPPLTEERRKELVKFVKKLVEDARIGVRNVRRDAIEDIKKMQKDGLPEDVAKDAEAEVQKITDSFMKKIDEMFEKKEKDIMTV